MLRQETHEQNRRSWNYMTAVHNAHKLAQAKYLREGGSTLFPEEVGLLGDVRGKRLVHLQCNSGQDTLSLVQLGAVATGVDISDEAVRFARQLAAESGLAAEFVRADIYDWFTQAAAAGEQFDIAFSSYGALCWLSDLGAWARGIHAVLAPGGKFVLVEFHPFINYLDDDWHLAPTTPPSGEPTRYDGGIGDYVAMSGELLAVSGYVEVEVEPNQQATYEYCWSVGDILGALLEAGLEITEMHEYSYANGCRLFAGMREEAGRRLYPPENVPAIPLMLGIAATRRDGTR